MKVKKIYLIGFFCIIAAFFVFLFIKKKERREDYAIDINAVIKNAQEDKRILDEEKIEEEKVELKEEKPQQEEKKVEEQQKKIVKEEKNEEDTIAKQLREAEEHIKNKEYFDAEVIYSTILTNEDFSFLDSSELLRFYLGRADCYFYEGRYKKAQENFMFALAQSAHIDNFDDVIYKLCFSIYSQMPYTADVDLGKCEDLCTIVATYGKYVKDQKVKDFMQEKEMEAKKLLDEKPVLYIEYYLERGLYDSSLYLCDDYLAKGDKSFFFNKVLLLKAKTLLKKCKKVYSYENISAFIKYKKKIQGQYKNFYFAEKDKFEEVFSEFDDLVEAVQKVIDGDKK